MVAKSNLIKRRDALREQIAQLEAEIAELEAQVALEHVDGEQENDAGTTANGHVVESDPADDGDPLEQADSSLLHIFTYRI